MSDINVNTGLAAILKTIKRPGDFQTAGVFDLVAPGIEVDDVGPVALPVLPEQAARLIAAAQRAPFGRGEQTIVDTDVRRSWQIAPGHIRIARRKWAGTIEAVAERGARGLGVKPQGQGEKP